MTTPTLWMIIMVGRSMGPGVMDLAPELMVNCIGSCVLPGLSDVDGDDARPRTRIAPWALAHLRAY